MKIVIGSDHAGFELKGQIISWLTELGHEVKDKGAFELNETDDFPDFVREVASEIEAESSLKGIVLGGSGEGEAMEANRHKKVRAAVYYGGDLEIVRLSRKHNNANIISLGARFLSLDEAKEAINIFLNESFSDDPKYDRRNKKLDDLL